MKRIMVVAGGLALLVSAPFVSTPAAHATTKAPFGVAHRAHVAGGGENTVADVKKVCALKGEAVEMDLRFSSSSWPVMMHDVTVDRTTNGTGYVGRHTVAQLKAMKPPVPTLGQALYAVTHCATGMRIYVDVKVNEITPLQLKNLTTSVKDSGAASKIVFITDASTALGKKRMKLLHDKKWNTGWVDAPYPGKCRTVAELKANTYDSTPTYMVGSQAPISCIKTWKANNISLVVGATGNWEKYVGYADGILTEDMKKYKTWQKDWNNPPSPSPTPTPITPTPTPTVTPVSALCEQIPHVYATQPDASNTGVPVGTTLSTTPPDGVQITSDGSWKVTVDGTIIDGKLIDNKWVDVQADNVVIKNSKIIVPQATYWAINDESNHSGLTIIDSEVTSYGGANTGVQGGPGFTVCGNNIHGFENIGSIQGDNVIWQSNYMHLHTPDPASADPHNDVLEVRVGKHIKILGNTLKQTNPDESWQQNTSALYVTANYGDIDDVEINGNWLGGGAYTMYLRTLNSGATENPPVLGAVDVINNKWYKNTAAYGPVSHEADWSPRTWSGNEWDDGSAIPFD